MWNEKMLTTSPKIWREKNVNVNVNHIVYDVERKIQPTTPWALAHKIKNEMIDKIYIFHIT